MDNEKYLKDREEFIKVLGDKRNTEDYFITHHKLLNKERDSTIYWFGEFKKQEEEIKKLKEELEKEKLKNNKKQKRKIKKGVQLTKNQINIIRELTEKHMASKETILSLFNSEYPNRKEPLTISQLRKIMKDNNIVKPKKKNIKKSNSMKEFD